MALIKQDRLVMSVAGLWPGLSACLLLISALGCHQATRQREVNVASDQSVLSHAEPSSVATSNAGASLPFRTNEEVTFTQSQGATNRDTVADKHMQLIWKSANSTAEERAEAVNKSLPRGASVESARALLGNNGRLVHYFGPYMEFGRDKNGNVTGRVGPPEDSWQLEYDTSRGKVGLRFLEGGGSSPGLHFDRAYPLQSGKTSSGK